MTIQSLETTYNNITFRSRLEARWAVFFDVLGAAWEYEPQVFDLGDLGHYLPDFLLPAWRYNKARETQPLWLEIKPPAFPAAALTKVRAVAELTGDRAILCAGIPSRRLRITGGHTLHMLFRYYGQREFKRALTAAQLMTFDAQS